MDALPDEARGTFIVTTESGAEYLLDLDLGFMNRRLPEDADIEFRGLRRDGVPVSLLAVIRCEIGEGMCLLINLHVPGVDFTSRRTTPVVSIEAVSVEVAR